jgi:hypothetical protein
MSDKLALRPAQPQDFAYCQRVYFECMKWIIQTLNLDLAQHREGFARQWQLAEVRIITVAGEDVGWLQTALADDAIFLGQLYLDGRFQRQGSAAVLCTYSSRMLYTRRRPSLLLWRKSIPRAGFMTGSDSA